MLSPSLVGRFPGGVGNPPTSNSRPTSGVKPVAAATSRRLWAALSPRTRYTDMGAATPLRSFGPRALTTKYPCTSRCVSAPISTVSGAVSPWRRAATLGVSPSAKFSCLPPSRRPPPVQYGCRCVPPTPPLWSTPGGYAVARWRRQCPALCTGPGAHRPHAPGASQSTPATHRPDIARYAPQSGRSPWHRCLDRPAPPRAILPGRAEWRARWSPPNRRTAR
jgi:hypothetical protein